MLAPRSLAAALAGLVALLVLVNSPAAQSAGGHAPAGKPQRIMSTNMCTDLLLLMLVRKERIASITHLAHDAVNALMPGADRGVAVNHGTAEEVVRDRPDLILANPWSTATMRRLGTKVGAPVVEIESASSFEDIRRITRQLGALVGETGRAEALIARMDRTLRALEASRPSPARRVIVWRSGDIAPGRGTLTDDIIRAAGAENSAAQRSGYASLSIEELLMVRPDAILRGEDGYNQPSLQEAATGHPVVRRAFRGRQIRYPAAIYACGLPQSAEAARQLRQAIVQLPAGGVSW